ncbi:MAG: M10 family metallopeptidase C-terminal domain-containing protein, partial [Pseudomonadota bacterium]
FWDDFGYFAYSFAHDADYVITYDVTDLTADGKQLAEMALDLWADVSGLTFQAVTNSNDAQIRFDDEGSGAYASPAAFSNGENQYSNVNVGKDWLDAYGTSIHSYNFGTYVHEIGHALGLGHTGNYNGSANFNQDAIFDYDSYQSSVMTYFNNDENPNVDASFNYVATPQAADIAAIQQIYGTNTSARTEDTVYGDNTTLDGFWGELSTVLEGGVDHWWGSTLTIYDDGGTDRLDLSSSTASQHIDLTPGAISDVMGWRGNLIIYFNTVIEEAVGGDYADFIRGNDADNTLIGGGGDDFLVGGLGADTIIGGDGTDTAILDGSASDYTVSVDFNGDLLLTDSDGDTDRYQGVEQFQFDLGSLTEQQLIDGAGDGPISVDVTESGGRLYIGNSTTGVAMQDADGDHIKTSDFSGWTFVAGYVDTGDVRLVFKNDADGLFREWTADTDGSFVETSDTKGPVALARLEEEFGDIDGDGQVAEMPDQPSLQVIYGILTMTTEEGDVRLIDERGRDLKDSGFKGWTFGGAAENDDGYGVAMIDEDGLLREMTFDVDGAVTGDAETTGAVALARLEDEYGDLDGDGQIAEMPDDPELIAVNKALLVSTADGDVPLLDDKGKGIKDSVLKKLTPVGAAETDDGVVVVLRDKDGNLIEWSADEDGQIIYDGSVVGEVALARLEDIFGDLDGDGQVTADPGAPELVIADKTMVISTDTGYVVPVDTKGKTFSEKFVSGWSADAVLEVDGGYKALLTQDDMIRVLEFDDEGRILSEEIASGDMMTARAEAIFGDIDGDGSVDDIPDRPDMVVVDKAVVMSTEDGIVTLFDEKGRALKDSALKGLEVVGALETDTGYAVLLDGDDGMVLWRFNDADTRVAIEGIGGEVALARAEDELGDLDGDGEVNEMPDDPELVAVDGELKVSFADGDLALVDAKGKALKESVLGDWEPAAGLEDGTGAKIAFRNTDEPDLWMEWTVDSNGRVTSESVTRGEVALAILEEEYGDIDGDGGEEDAGDAPDLVALNKTLRIVTMDAEVQLVDAKGKAIKDTALKGWEVAATGETDTGGYHVVLIDEDGAFREWTIDANGLLSGDAETNGAVALARFEDIYGDIDGDGEVAEMPEHPELIAAERTLRVSTESGDIALTDDRGKAVKDSALKGWETLAVRETDTGYTVIMQDEDSYFREWQIDSNGLLTSETETFGDVALARFEDEHGDIDGDGAVADMPEDPELIAVDRTLRLSTSEGDLALLDVRGKAMKDSLLKTWTALSATEEGDGFRVVLQDDDGIFREWQTDANGNITSDIETTGNVALARFEAVLGDIDGDGQIAAMPTDPEVIAVDGSLLIATADGDIKILNARGNAMKDSLLKTWTPVSATEDGDGFLVVLQDADGTFREWETDATGTIISDVESTGNAALARLEAIHGDIDGDGLVGAEPVDLELIEGDGKLKIATEDGDLAVVNRLGNALNAKAVDDWDSVSVEEDGDGYIVSFSVSSTRTRTLTLDEGGKITHSFVAASRSEPEDVFVFNEELGNATPEAVEPILVQSDVDAAASDLEAGLIVQSEYDALIASLNSEPDSLL